MVDFRKSFLLAAMALVIGVGTASAQSGTCAATTGAPPTLRHEGLTELTGAFVVSCTGVSPSTVNFDVSLNNAVVPITSRGGEALVTVNNDGVFTTYTGTIVSTGTPGALPNNDVRFTGVVISSAAPVISFTGIRADVTGIPFIGGFGQVLAVLSVSNGVLPISQVNNGLFVGVILPGLAAVGATGPVLNACAGSITLLAGNYFTVTIPENFPTAFKQQGPISLGAVNGDSETGPTPGALQANTGTQFAVTFSSIPTGVSFYVPLTITSSAGGTAILVNEGSNSILAGSDVAGTGVLYAPATGTVFYNVIGAAPSTSETFTLPVYNTGATLTGGLATSATVNLAPLNADNSTTVPRFIGGNGPVSFSNSQTGCQTSLLFPFLSNQAGFDTGISIAATGTDPFGSNISGGTCTLNLYGTGAPATAPTLSVAGGNEGHTTMSAVAPGFQGYGIAICTFTYAHGYAFISDGFMGGGRGLSEGYTANVINFRGTASSSIGGATSTPETLGH